MTDDPMQKIRDAVRQQLYHEDGRPRYIGKDDIPIEEHVDRSVEILKKMRHVRHAWSSDEERRRGVVNVVVIPSIVLDNIPVSITLAKPCATCDSPEEMKPSHDGSPNCESGSIASGGTRAHCTCDTCF